MLKKCLQDLLIVNSQDEIIIVILRTQNEVRFLVFWIRLDPRTSDKKRKREERRLRERGKSRKGGEKKAEWTSSEST